MSSGGRKCEDHVTTVTQPNQHNTVVSESLVNHGTVMSTDDNQNVISAASKGKSVVNAAPKGQKSKAFTKRVFSGGRKCGSTVTTVTKPKKHNTVLLDGSKTHCDEMSTDDNNNVISSAHKGTKFVNDGVEVPHGVFK